MRVASREPAHGSYCDLDPINLYNIVHSDERGYYAEWWNLDMENGKCSPKLGAIDWSLYKAWFRERGLCDIAGNSSSRARGGGVEIEFRAPHAINVQLSPVISTRSRALLNSAAGVRLLPPWERP